MTNLKLCLSYEFNPRITEVDGMRTITRLSWIPDPTNSINLIVNEDKKLIQLHNKPDVHLSQLITSNYWWIQKTVLFQLTHTWLRVVNISTTELENRECAELGGNCKRISINRISIWCWCLSFPIRISIWCRCLSFPIIIKNQNHCN